MPATPSVTGPTRRLPRRGRRAVIPALSAAVVAAFAAVVVFAAVPASAARPRAAVAAPIVYAALGDSFASGVGTGRYDLAGAPCDRSSLAYPALWARSHPVRGFTFVACSGTWTGKMLVQQVPRIPRDADLVTVTVGGNDVGFLPVLATCSLASSDRTCTATVTVARTLAMAGVVAQLAATLPAIKLRAPHARIVVLGYPRLFESDRCPAGVPDAARRKAINAGADTLDRTLSRMSALFKVRFVDVRDRFAGHGVCAPTGQAWITGPDAGHDAYHPSPEGQRQGLLPALLAVTG